MSTVEEHREEIKGAIINGSFDDDLLDKWINMAIRKMSSLVLLPVLERTGQVNTVVGSPFIDVPEDFGHNLFFASSPGGPITVLSSIAAMLEEFPLFSVDNEVGTIEFCCLSGRKVAIHPVPAVITATTLFYHTWPAVLEYNESVDQYISQEDDQEDIIHNFVLWRANKQIEDGIEGGNQFYTKFYKAEFEKAVDDFKVSIKQGQSRPVPDRRRQGI